MSTSTGFQLALMVVVVVGMGFSSIEWSQTSGTIPGTGPKGQARTVLVAARAPKQSGNLRDASDANSPPQPGPPGTHPWARKLYTRNDINGMFGSTDGSKRVCDEACMVQPFGDKNDAPPWANSYFNKNAHLMDRVNDIKDKSGVALHDGRVWTEPIVGRVFAAIDLYDWNATWGFLDCTRYLSLYRVDVEKKFLSPRCRESTVTYAYGDKENEGHWGDLHYPISVDAGGTEGGTGTEKFDLITFGQTLEHLYDPVLCLRNLYDALAPGGFLFTSVPMLNHVHMAPYFFSMPTTWGLALWCKTAGFEVLRVGQFGNAQQVENIHKNPTWWPKTKAYFNASRVPQIINNPWTPVDIWVLARKPLE